MRKMIVLILLLVVVITSLLPLFFRRKIHERLHRLNFSLKWLGLVCIIINLLLFTTLIMANYNYYWRGFLSTSIILILACLITLLYYYYFNKVSDFIWTFLTVYLFILIPASQIIILNSIYAFNENVFYNDSNYRLEETFNGIIAHQQLPKLFVKKGLFERKYLEEKGSPWVVLNKDDSKSIEIEKKEDYFEVSFIMENDSIIMVNYIMD